MGTYEYLLEWGGIKNQPWSESGVGTEIGNPPYTVAIPSLNNIIYISTYFYFYKITTLLKIFYQTGTTWRCNLAKFVFVRKGLMERGNWQSKTTTVFLNYEDTRVISALAFSILPNGVTSDYYICLSRKF